MFHLRDLHAQYGPIIRINPYELHVIDSTFYDTLYTFSTSRAKRHKWEWATKQFGTLQAMLSTTSHDRHRMRRSALDRFFSMASVKRLQPLIDERVAKLLEKLRGFMNAKGSDGVIKLDYAYSAFSNDEFSSFRKRVLTLVDIKEPRLLPDTSAARCKQKYRGIFAKNLQRIVCHWSPTEAL